MRLATPFIGVASLHKGTFVWSLAVEALNEADVPRLEEAAARLQVAVHKLSS